MRYRPDGDLECLGRLDHQVKLRGIRIELGEIEVVLAQHPAVRQTVVIAHEDISGEWRLVAYVVPVRELYPSLRELRSFLAKQLPAAMLPATFVMLETLPLTPSGKVNRQALPAPGPMRADCEDLYVAPRTPIEQQIAAIWCRLLGLAQVGIYDNFFELGGHSLLAMQVLFRIRSAIHVEVSLLGFFETPTVAGIAAIIATADQVQEGRQAAPLVPIPRDVTVPSSIAQEHFWLFDQILPALPLFNISYVIRLTGTLNAAILEQSFNEIINRHESLRTTFAAVSGQLVQVIAPTSRISVAVRDLQAWPENERAREAQRLIQAEGRQPFNLTQGPLLRGCLLALSQRDYLLLVTLHHIVGDGWSLGILIQELAVLYDAFATGMPSPLPPLPIQYADFASWQRQWRHDAVMQAQLTYWKEQLHEPLPMLELAANHPRGIALPFHTARQPLELPSVLVDALKRMSHREGSTLFMTCVAAFKILLYGYTGQEDVCVATLVANRTRPETEGLIGLLVNMVILRTNLSSNPTSRQVLQRVRATTLAAYAHQDLPFEELVRTLEDERNLGRTSLCQVMVIWQNSIPRPLQYSAQTLSFHPIDQGAVVPDVPLTTFDITLTLREKPQGMTAVCLYNAEMFDVVTIHHMLDDFQHVLTCLSTQPEQVLESFCTLLSRHGRG